MPRAPRLFFTRVVLVAAGLLCLIGVSRQDSGASTPPTFAPAAVLSGVSPANQNVAVLERASSGAVTAVLRGVAAAAAATITLALLVFWSLSHTHGETTIRVAVTTTFRRRGPPIS